MQLTGDNVRKVFLNCLFDEGYTDKEVEERGKIVKSVMVHVGFDSAKVNKNKEHIIELLEQLPDNFRKSSGSGGWSFLEACMDKDNHQWGEHRSIDELLALGLAIDKIEFLAPREAWSALPGGLPYFIYLDK
jgi:hypothetical protein